MNDKWIATLYGICLTLSISAIFAPLFVWPSNVCLWILAIILIRERQK